MHKRHEDPKVGIQVYSNDEKWFEPFRWREAIRHWQEKIWSGQFNRGRRHLHMKPARFAGNAILRIHTGQQGPTIDTYASIVYDADTGLYEATGHGFGIREVLTTSPSLMSCDGTSGDFESVLSRFARDRAVRSVLLQLPSPRHVTWLALVNVRGRLMIGL